MIYGLLKKINNKPAVIGIIELGYVGLPLVIRFINEKYRKLNWECKCSDINAILQSMWNVYSNQ